MKSKTLRKGLACIIFLISILSCETKTLDTTQEEKSIHTLLDDWHKAAATADEEAFFGAFTKNGIYIGTDATEHWKATELQTWAKKAFARDSAWVFKPHDRHIFFSKDGKTVWFDELLNTWMGECRGSGVLEKENNQWKIAHYHLAIAVPNDKVDAYLQLFKK